MTFFNVLARYLHDGFAVTICAACHYHQEAQVDNFMAIDMVTADRTKSRKPNKLQKKNRKSAPCNARSPPDGTTNTQELPAYVSQIKACGPNYKSTDGREDEDINVRNLYNSFHDGPMVPSAEVPAPTTAAHLATAFRCGTLDPGLYIMLALGISEHAKSFEIRSLIDAIMQLQQRKRRSSSISMTAILAAGPPSGIVEQTPSMAQIGREPAFPSYGAHEKVTQSDATFETNHEERKTSPGQVPRISRFFEDLDGLRI